MKIHSVLVALALVLPVSRFLEPPTHASYIVSYRDLLTNTNQIGAYTGSSGLVPLVQDAIITSDLAADGNRFVAANIINLSHSSAREVVRYDLHGNRLASWSIPTGIESINVDSTGVIYGTRSGFDLSVLRILPDGNILENQNSRTVSSADGDGTGRFFVSRYVGGTSRSEIVAYDPFGNQLFTSSVFDDGIQQIVVDENARRLFALYDFGSVRVFDIGQDAFRVEDDWQVVGFPLIENVDFDNSTGLLVVSNSQSIGRVASTGILVESYLLGPVVAFDAVFVPEPGTLTFMVLVVLAMPRRLRISPTSAREAGPAI